MKVSHSFRDVLQNYMRWVWWPLVTVIREGTATPPDKDFIKTKQHRVFHSGAKRYDV